MSHPIQGQVFTGSHAIDAKALDGKLYDLPPGETQRCRREREGFEGVAAELATAAPTLPMAADPYATFQSHTATIAQIRAARALVDKLAEVLAESEAKYEHEREMAIGTIVDAAKSAAARTGNKAVHATFERTIAYVAQYGLKAAATRRKNKEAKAQGKPG